MNKMKRVQGRESIQASSVLPAKYWLADWRVPMLATLYALALPLVSQASTAATSEQAKSSASVAQQAMLEFENVRREAVARCDVKVLDAMSAPDLIYVNATNGVERNKQEYLEHIVSEDIHYNSYALHDTAAKVYGDLAVTTGTFVFDVTVNGRNNQGAQYYTAVYIRRGGEWQQLIWHPTVVAKK